MNNGLIDGRTFDDIGIMSVQLTLLHESAKIVRDVHAKWSWDVGSICSFYRHSENLQHRCDLALHYVCVSIYDHG